MEYPTSKKLSIALRDAIDSNSKRIPFQPAQKILEWQDLIDFVGKTFDIEKNRKRALKPGLDSPFSQVLRDTLRENRIAVLKKILLEYDKSQYGPVLTQRGVL
jgi:hypothetical protein